MAYTGYNTRFFFRFESQAGREFRIDIKKLGYTGSAQQRPLGQTPVLKRESGDNGVHGTSLEIYAVCKTDGEYAELYTSSAREYLVVLSEVSGGTTTALWHGFITPELYAEPEVAPPYDVQIVATDGLGELKLYDFEASGRVSLYTHLYNLLSTTGIDCNQSDIIVINSLSCTTPSISAANILTGIYVNLDHLAGSSTRYDALVGILSSLHISITRYADKWLLYRDSDIHVSGGSISANNAAGVSTTLPVAEYGSMQDHGWWPIGRVETEVEPAKNRVAVAFPFNLMQSMFVNPNLPDGTGWTYPTPLPGVEHYVNWLSFAGGEMRPELYNSETKGSTTIYQDISVESYDGPLTLKILTALYSELDAQTYSVFFRLRLTASGATYYLKRRDLGESYEWSTDDTEIEYKAERLSGYTGTRQIPISAFNENSFGIPGIPASGTLRIEITSKSKNFSLWYKSQDFYLGGVFLLQDAVPGYRDIIVIDNGARGGDNDITVEFGDSQYVANALKNFYNVASNNSGVACSEWEDARYSGEMLSVISMDYALGVALPRLKARGSFNVPSSAQIPMAFVNPDGITMLIRESSWKILTDDLEVQLISVPAASLTITSETITELTAEEAQEAGGSGGSSHSGGSGSGGGGSSTSKYFVDVIDETTGELIGAEALNDLYVIQEEADEQEGTDEELKNITEILRHLSLQIVDEGLATERTVLVSDISLGSQLAVFAGGIGNDGGGGSGGSLATLTDVTLTNLSDNQVLRYNAQTSHWENKTLTLALSALSDVNIGTPTDGQVLKYNAATSKWIAAADAGGIASVSLSGGTNNGTLKLTVDGSSTDNIAVTGLAALAYKSGLSFSDLTSHPTTISGYGITDAKIANGVITLGGNTITPLVSVPAATDSEYGGFKTGYSESGKYYAVKLSSGKAYVNVPWTDTVYTHPTGGANTTITAANKRVLSAITVDQYGHVTSVSSKDLSTSDIPDLSGTYLPLTGGTLTGDLRLKSGNYGLSLYFGDSSYAYLSEDTDDHLTMYGSKGISLLTSSSSYGVVIGSSGTATPATIYGDATIYGNITIGASTSTATAKTLTCYGRQNSSYPAIIIYGVGQTNYSTSIYRDSSALQIGSNLAVSGNITATGAITAGSASDRRLKKDIKSIDINAASAVLSKLKPVEYDWNDEAKRLGNYAGHSRGFLADEYLDAIPGAGRKIWGEYDAIDYEQSIPYLVAGWQQQNIRIRILEGEISVLKEELNHLRRNANVIR